MLKRMNLMNNENEEMTILNMIKTKRIMKCMKHVRKLLKETENDGKQKTIKDIDKDE